MTDSARLPGLHTWREAPEPFKRWFRQVDAAISTTITATADVSAIGQIEPNSSTCELVLSFTMLTVAKFVSTSVATAADTIGGPILREYLTAVSPGVRRKYQPSS